MFGETKMNERTINMARKKQLNKGDQLMIKTKSYNKKFGNAKRRKPRIRTAKITYKQSPRQKAAKLMAAEHKLMITNSVLPDWIDHERLWDIQRRYPIIQST